MWLFNDRGFYSVVQKPGQIHEDLLTVRSRVRADLVRLCVDLEIDPVEIRSTEEADYPFRLVLHRDDFALWVGSRIGRLEYPNFKDRVFEVFGRARANLYHRIWSICLKIEDLQEREVDRG